MRENEEEKIRDAMYFGESAVYEQPAVDPTIEQERKQIEKKHHYATPLSPESLITRAIQPPIDLIDLYSYHELALNPKVKKLLEIKPTAKIVCVGLEFESGGMQKPSSKGTSGETNYNLFLVNYDGLCFLKKLQSKTVDSINFDFPYVEGETLNIVKEASRVLVDGGSITFYIERNNPSETIEKIKTIGFKHVEIFSEKDKDSFENRYRYSGVKENVRIIAHK